MIDEILHKLYYDPIQPCSFGSARKLFEAAKKHKISFDEVKKWLSKQITYTLHRPRRIRYKRNPIVVSAVDQQWQADLVDVSEFAKDNKNYKYLITIIDVMSKFAFVFATKSKKASEVSVGFEQIFKKRKPQSLQTDQGGEFDNKKLTELLKKHDIRYFTTRNTETKCAIVERFNRTLRGRMFRYFTSKGTRTYLDILPKLVDAYNNSVHRSIKMKPIDVKLSDSSKLFKTLYGCDNMRQLYQKSSTSNLKPGDNVRIQYMSNPFSKGYYPTWTDETFTIAKTSKDVNKSQYTLKDYTGAEIEGRFYPEEVQAVASDTYRVEKVIKKRTLNGVKQLFVKWVNYGNEHNSWINETDYVDVS